MTIARIAEHARKTPDRTAIILDGEAISYREFARRIGRARTFLMQQNLPAASLVAVCIADTVDCWSMLLALQSLGHVSACVGMLPDVRHLTPHKLECVILRESESRPALADLAAKLGFRHVSVPADFISGEEGKGAAAEIPPSTGGHLVFTSGTTGTIKKILIDTGNEAAHFDQRLEAFDIKKDSIVNIFDWAKWSSVGYTVPMGVWSIGAQVAFILKQTKHASLGLKGLTHAIGTPNMVSDLLSSPFGPTPQKDGFRFYVGGGPLPVAFAEAAINKITRHLFTMVGSTEAGVWCVTPIERPQDTASHVIAPSRIVQIVDDEERALPAGETGSIRIAVLKNTTSYYGDEEATRNFFRNGFFYPGDLGAFDAKGRLTLQGRATDIVYVNGKKFSVAPFERALQNRLFAEEVCIFAKPAGNLDDELFVVVQGNPGLSADALKAIAAEELARFPNVRFHFLRKFPRNDRGKVVRHALREQILSGQKG